MITIIVITLVCWLLFQVGAVGRFLKLFELEPTGERLETHYTAPPISERELLEKQAAAVVAAMGEDSRTVKYMSDGLLQALINDYTKINK